MKFVRRRLTYANVMSTIAVFLVVAGGSALAANQLGKNTVGSKQLKKNAVVAAKVKNGAITGGKLANGAVTNSKLGGGAVGASNLAANSVGSSAIADNAVTGSKIAAGAVGSGNIANGAVGAEKLAASARSHAYQFFHEGTQNIQIQTGLLENYLTATALATLTVPSANYYVSASVDFLNDAIATRTAICRLFEGQTEVGDGSTVVGESILVPQGTVTVTGLSKGGTLTLRCRASGNDLFDWDAKITAVTVDDVN